MACKQPIRLEMFKFDSETNNRFWTMESNSNVPGASPNATSQAGAGSWSVMVEVGMTPLVSLWRRSTTKMSRLEPYGVGMRIQLTKHNTRENRGHPLGLLL